ncbi:MAG: T9SS type A sorting domain-containing protein [Rhodothermaceae bacterium]
MKTRFYILVLIAFMISSYAGEKRVLIEVLTNSHCPLCVPAYSAIDSYLSNGQNKTKVDYIYYHMVFPYSDDPLYQENTSDANKVNSYYGPFSSTPKAFFNGQIQSNNYSGWSGVLDAQTTGTSPLDVALSGTIADNQSNSFDLKITIDRNGTVADSDLEAKIVVVEDVNYLGRNGVSDRKNIMRKIVDGIDVTISDGSQIVLNQTVTINGSWDKNKLSAVVFIQSKSAKTVYQSATIDYTQFNITDIEEEDTPLTFALEQNYPNPFNPSTTIEYSLEEKSQVKLTVYSILGEQVATLVDAEQSSGSYKVTFAGNDLPSGIYLYRLQTDDKVFTKKMVMMK